MIAQPVQAVEYTSANVAQMRANAAAIHRRCFMPAVRPASPVVPKAIPPVPRKVPEWQSRPTFFDAHVVMFRVVMEASRLGRKPILQIVDEVLLGFPGVSLADVRGPQQTRVICDARFMAMHEVREQTGLSLHAIGHWFGGRDHSTTLNAIRRAAARKAATIIDGAGETSREGERA